MSIFSACSLLLVLAWVGYFVLGKMMGRTIAALWPGIIGKLGGSKVPDLAVYVTHRLQDGIYLATLVFAALVISRIVARWLARRWEKSLLGFLWIAVLLFLGANVWCYGAGRTVLFWLLLRGTTVENQAQFKAKELLLDDVTDRPLIALVGSSQARAQFNEEKFNELSGSSLWMMELHFPGSLAADVYFVSRRWEREKVDGFVYYVSPMSFFSQNETAIGRDLLRLRDLPEVIRLGGWTQISAMTRPYVVLGTLMPLFQARPVLQHAVYGIVSPGEVALPQQERKEVRRKASTIRVTPAAEFQKAAFLEFLESTRDKGQKVILVMGQFNPLQEAEMAPDVRPAFEAFIRECAVRFPHVLLVTQEEILKQGQEAYVDATHVTEETALRFTSAFSEWFQRYESERGAFFDSAKRSPVTIP